MGKTVHNVCGLPRFLGLWVFGLLCHHTASTPITSGTHTSGAQYEGSPQNPDRIERHSQANIFFFESRHTASAPNTSGTHTGGV